MSLAARTITECLEVLGELNVAAVVAEALYLEPHPARFDVNGTLRRLPERQVSL